MLSVGLKDLSALRMNNEELHWIEFFSLLTKIFVQIAYLDFDLCRMHPLK